MAIGYPIPEKLYNSIYSILRIFTIFRRQEPTETVSVRNGQVSDVRFVRVNEF